MGDKVGGLRMTIFRSHAVQRWLLACALAAGACSDAHAPAKQPAHPADMSQRVDAGANGSGGNAQPSDFGNTNTAVDASAPRARSEPPDVLQSGGDARLQCPMRMDCQSEPLVSTGRLLASSANIADDARFIAIADRIILAERGSDMQPVLLRVPEAEVIEFATTRLTHPKAIAIAGDHETTLSLLCDEQACEVFSLRSYPNPASAPERVASIDAASGALTGIVAGGCANDNYDFCVFGDGLFCFDDRDWITEIDKGNARILSAAVDREPGACRTLLVAGEHGMLQRYHSGWQTIDTGVTADLTTIAAYSGRFSAAGDRVLIEGDPYGFVVCELEDFAVQKLIRIDGSNSCSTITRAGFHVNDEAAEERGFDSILYGITPQGQLVLGRDGCNGSETWRCDQQSAPNIDFSLIGCGIAANPWQLTADELNGEPIGSCPID